MAFDWLETSFRDGSSQSRFIIRWQSLVKVKTRGLTDDPSSQVRVLPVYAWQTWIASGTGLTLGFPILMFTTRFERWSNAIYAFEPASDGHLCSTVSWAIRTRRYFGPDPAIRWRSHFEFAQSLA
jgi:hypothetical protein